MNPYREISLKIKAKYLFSLTDDANFWVCIICHLDSNINQMTETSSERDTILLPLDKCFCLENISPLFLILSSNKYFMSVSICENYDHSQIFSTFLGFYASYLFRASSVFSASLACFESPEKR